jgi:hypothetical protein
MKQALVLHVTDEGWRALTTDQRWLEVTPWAALSQPAIVVLELEQSHTDVWRFEGKPDHAAAIIEKRVRTEGFVDGAAHVVVHQVQAFPGGFQAFFSALPLDLWQQASAWAAAQKDHCVLVHSAALLTLGLRVGGGRAMVGPRGWAALAWAPSGLSYLTARVVGRNTGEETFSGATRLLASQWGPLGSGLDRVQIGVLGVDASIRIDELAAFFARTASVDAKVDTLQVFQPSQQGLPAWKSSLPDAARLATSGHVLNPGLARMAWQAEAWVGRLTGVVALVAVGLMGASLHARTQVDGLRELVAQRSLEVSDVEQRIARLGLVEPPPALLETAEFARRLDEGRQLDPMRLLTDLQRQTPAEIRVQRVKLEPSAAIQGKLFRVEGTAAIGDSVAMMRWVSAMETAGWRMKAIDPSDANPGAWAYEVIRQTAATQESRT